MISRTDDVGLIFPPRSHRSMCNCQNTYRLVLVNVYLSNVGKDSI